MRSILFIFIFILLWVAALNENNIQQRFALWNVGQGQWATYNDGKTCWHLDQGGEWAPLNLIKKFCQFRENRILISHTDYDHYQFNDEWMAWDKNSCYLNQPAPYPKKIRTFRKTKLCDSSENAIQLITPNVKKNLNSKKKINSNDYSMIAMIHSLWLIPGDSPKNQEKIWSHQLQHFRTLVLGHHGSRTSTSDLLLNRTTPLWVMASQRRKKYGHPHQEVLTLLQKRKTPILLTEDWGSIIKEK